MDNRSPNFDLSAHLMYVPYFLLRHVPRQLSLKAFSYIDVCGAIKLLQVLF